MANKLFGGNVVLDNIQNGLCGGGYGYTPVMEQVVSPINIKTTPQTPTTPVPVQQTPAPQVQPQTPTAAPQQHVNVQPSAEAAMYVGAHAYVEALRAQQQGQQNAAAIAAAQRQADARHKGQVAFNRMAGEAIAECGEAIQQNSEAIRGLQHRCKNAEARAKAQQAEIDATKAEMKQLKAQQKAQANELQQLKAQQAQQAAEIEKLKAHDKVQNKRLDNLESNMRKANAFMNKFGKKK